MSRVYTLVKDLYIISIACAIYCTVLLCTQYCSPDVQNCIAQFTRLCKNQDNTAQPGFAMLHAPNFAKKDSSVLHCTYSTV